MQRVQQLRPYTRTLSSDPRSLNQLRDDVVVVLEAMLSSFQSDALPLIVALLRVLRENNDDDDECAATTSTTNDDRDVMFDRLRSIRQELVGQHQQQQSESTTVIVVAARMTSLFLFCEEIVSCFSQQQQQQPPPQKEQDDEEEAVAACRRRSAERGVASLHEVVSMLSLLREDVSISLEEHHDSDKETLLLLAPMEIPNSTLFAEFLATLDLATCVFFGSASKPTTVFPPSQIPTALWNSVPSFIVRGEGDDQQQVLLTAICRLRKVVLLRACSSVFRPQDGVVVERLVSFC